MKVGILGGGQLSRMLALAGIPLGFDFCFYEPSLENGVSQLGQVIQKPYSDIEALASFIESCDVITYENENIPVETATLIAKCKPLHPNTKALKTTQDRLLEKTMFDHLSIPTVAYQAIDSKATLENFLKLHGSPIVLKKRRQGYDGKGQCKINSMQDIIELSNDFLNDAIAEQFIAFDREISIIAVKGINGDCRYYDICQNYHEKGILHHTQNKIDDPMFNTAKIYVDKVIQHLDYVGCISFEFFQKGTQLFANEIAPRVHNSGHWTIEGAQTSQFENHLRAITGMGLGNTASTDHFQMFNLLGAIPDKEGMMNYDFVHLHDYQKIAKPGRKVGHITLLLSKDTTEQKEKFLKECLNKVI
ncbi:5-(carboxyamino)imidazole ribonucleotide synthase [Candidatus Berkiella cookevillensis]|uniref:N5-carboxyaminoimidazole ribonucleotide synthase n=1 Tax=Candidatus Berkiella cookevillensis TaxID=437022 RepID=A0A0Q9YBB5_9GAMM|nr:5-(carboxyamino)imidazole ribonucleotide synthase [Candidatus Berkiella cookevillensis]MCS5709139.1 5-(carboxyamino)imidazole ribonucleotide synthase [Candidatus Berkiella cookevillensis]